ncbi:MAG: flagellar hook-associated protein FlgK [Epulopiscium sp. Nuni2H_MBin003]|nr:MAG: flagellar hook-associated protein FlgK [Epulopiscium sp. Nuni2H_MBin003]
MSSFAEINIAMTGLFAAQRGLAITGNNVANMNTAGYSRQILTQEASIPRSLYGTGMIGTGVSTTGVYRIRDTFYDQKLWAQNDRLGEYEVKSQQNSLIEGIFGEPTDDAFAKVYTDFFNSINNLSLDPTAAENKTSLYQNMQSFTDYYYKMSSSLESSQSDLNFELKAVVEEINMYTTRIQSLNQQIFLQEMHEFGVANDLRDQRDLCLDELSKLVNIQAEEVSVYNNQGVEMKQFRVTLNGQTLVDHLDMRLLALEVRDEKVNDSDLNDLYNVVWEDKLPFDMNSSTLSGELKGVIDMRDGAGTSNTTSTSTYNGIPYYIARLDEFVQTFAEQMNEIYNKDADGNTIVDEDGFPIYALFSYVDDTGQVVSSNDPNFDYSKITAQNLSIAKEILEDFNYIRTNFEDDPNSGENPNPGSNDLLMQLFDQQYNNKFFNHGTPSEYMISVFSTLGITTSDAKMYYSTQNNVVSAIEQQRMAISQVDSNEEFMNLIKYNQAYQAAAKVMNTIDEIYNTTINQLGNF